MVGACHGNRHGRRGAAWSKLSWSKLSWSEEHPTLAVLAI